MLSLVYTGICWRSRCRYNLPEINVLPGDYMYIEGNNGMLAVIDTEKDFDAVFKYGEQAQLVVRCMYRMVAKEANELAPFFTEKRFSLFPRQYKDKEYHEMPNSTTMQ
jgi:hypothetical protein